MSISGLRKTQKVIKDLILFDSVWKKRNKIQLAKKLQKKTIKRIAVYRDLVKSSFSSLISNIYPHTKRFFNKKWNELLSKYIETYPPSSPILNKAAEHLPKYLSKRKDILKKYPFIGELAHYEWLEVEIYERDGETAKRRRGGKNKGLILNPIHEICKFEYPIPEIIERLVDKRKIGKITKQPTNVLIYRDPKTLQVRFIELSDGALTYLQLLEMGFHSGFIPKFLTEHYQIEGSSLKGFHSELNKLVKTLKDKRILIPQTT